MHFTAIKSAMTRNISFEDVTDVTPINQSISEVQQSYDSKVHLLQPVFMKNPEEMLRPWVINPFFFHIIITHAVTLVFGLFGNMIVVIVMLKDKKSRSATNLFLVSLAFGDLLLLLVCVPLEIVQYFVLQWDENGVVCRLATYGELLSAIVSVLNLAAVTLERFIVIVFPIKSRSLCTISNCKKALVMVWILSLILSTPTLYIKNTFKMIYSNNVTHVTLHYCNDLDSHWSTVFALYQFFIIFGAPGTLMIICYGMVIHVLWKSTRNMQILTNSLRGQKTIPKKSCASVNERVTDTRHKRGAHFDRSNRIQKGEDVRRARKQVIKMLILVTALFLICWGPWIVILILIKFRLHSYTPTYYILRIVFKLLPFIHACMNPLIYSFMSKNFRHALNHQLQKAKCIKKKHKNLRMNYRYNGRFQQFQSSTTFFTQSWHGFRFSSGRGSTSSSTTNCVTEITKETRH